jgi:hypothetical protein
MRDLAPLAKWLSDVESVVSGRSVLTYRDATGVARTFTLRLNGEFVGRLYEHAGRLCVLGRDPSSGLVEGGPLDQCSISKVDTKAPQAKPQKRPKPEREDVEP